MIMDNCKNINLSGKDYIIPNDLWNKHVEMHPIRPIDGLAHNLKIVYGERGYSLEEIKSVIMYEYKVHSHMSDKLDNAEKKYEGK